MEDRFTAKSALRAVAWMDSPVKPTWIKGHPVAASLVGLLLAHDADEHPWVVTHNTLAQSCACSPRHISDEIKLLEAEGWMTKIGVKGEVKGFSLIDTEDGYSKYVGTQIQITHEAKEFASWYRSVQQQHWAEVSKRNKREASKKALEQGRQLNAARVIQHAGNVDRAKAMATYAIESPKYRKRALQTPYNLQIVLAQKSFIDDFESGVPAKPVEPPRLLPLQQSFISKMVMFGKTKHLEPLGKLRQQAFTLKHDPQASPDERAKVEQELATLARMMGVMEGGDEWQQVVGGAQ